MAHNGGRHQIQPNFLYSGGLLPFVNKVKSGGFGNPSFWEYSAGGRPAASILNSFGMPTSVAGGSLRLIIEDEGLTYRPGKRILRWTGNQTFTVSGATLDSGSLTGTNGRAVMTLSNATSLKSVTITLTATDGSLTKLIWLHESDETRYDAEKAANPNCEPFSDKFIQTIQANNPGVMRFLDWQMSNTSNVFSWSHRTPVEHYSYSASYFDPTLYAGVLGGTNPNYTATLSGFSLTDGATVQVDIPAATVASGTTTLNVSGIGAKNIKLPNGSAWSRSSTGTDRRGTFTYIAILDCFIYFSTDFNEGLMCGVPPEVMIDLCNKINCHIHVVPPPLACDSPSDFMQRFAEFAAANLNTGLQFRCEAGPNECWGNFDASSLANLYSTARYGVASINDWYGRSGSVIGALLHTAFGGDRSRYKLLCGVQTVGSPDNVSGPNTSRRVESTRHVAAGGVPASTYLSHIMPANYWTTEKTPGTSTGTTAQNYEKFVNILTRARLWNAGDAATKLAQIDWLYENDNAISWLNTNMTARLNVWSAVAQKYNLGLTFYEGNYYPGDITTSACHGIDGVTLGNPTVITINNVNGAQGHAFVSGMTCSFRNIVGTTQLNNQPPYTVLSVTPTTVTIDVDSTSFGTFVSGGSGTWNLNSISNAGIVYTGYGGPITQPGILHFFYYACRFAAGSFYAAQHCFNLIMSYPNAEFPSDFSMGGGVGQWNKFDDIYSTPSPQWDAMTLFSKRLRRHRLTATV